MKRKLRSKADVREISPLYSLLSWSLWYVVWVGRMRRFETRDAGVARWRMMWGRAAGARTRRVIVHGNCDKASYDCPAPPMSTGSVSLVGSADRGHVVPRSCGIVSLNVRFG